MSSADRVAELTATFAVPSLDVAGLLYDRHPADHVTFTVVDGNGNGNASRLTFGDVAANSNRCARAQQGLGVGPGDRAATLTDKSTDLATDILAIWRLGAVYVPLFTAFAPQGHRPAPGRLGCARRGRRPGPAATEAVTELCEDGVGGHGRRNAGNDQLGDVAEDLGGRSVRKA